MASRELTFAEEAARYEIEARMILSEECDQSKVMLIERGRRIILKAQKLMAARLQELILLKRKIGEELMTKEEIDELLLEYGHEKIIETDIGVYYLKKDDSWFKEIHTDLLGGKIFITAIDPLNRVSVPTGPVAPEELDLFRRRAELWTAEEKK